MFETKIKEMEEIRSGQSLTELRKPTIKETENLGQRWHDEDYSKLASRYNELIVSGKSKKDVIELLCEEFGRGRFSIAKALEKADQITPLSKKPTKRHHAIHREPIVKKDQSQKEVGSIGKPKTETMKSDRERKVTLFNFSAE